MPSKPTYDVEDAVHAAFWRPMVVHKQEAKWPHYELHCTPDCPLHQFDDKRLLRPAEPVMYARTAY